LGKGASPKLLRFGRGINPNYFGLVAPSNPRL
jgi:hypothetical protein